MAKSYHPMSRARMPGRAWKHLSDRVNSPAKCVSCSPPCYSPRRLRFFPSRPPRTPARVPQARRSRHGGEGRGGEVAPTIDEANAVGNLRADEAITIRPEIAGRIVEMPFKEGENVNKGDRLAALDAAEFRAIVASSSAQAMLEQQRRERSEDLFKKGFISQQALDESRSTLARSKAKLAEDEARLAKTEIRAPFPGVVGLRQVSEGAFVAAGTDIARLEKIDQLKLDFRVPENFLGRLKSHQSVRIQVDAYATDTFSGAVYAIEPAVDEQTRTVLVRARVANSGLKLRPGMFARVYLRLAVREKAIWIPEAAIVPRGKAGTVFRIVDGRRNRWRCRPARARSEKWRS